jgi:hypothetical protein
MDSNDIKLILCSGSGSDPAVVMWVDPVVLVSLDRPASSMAGSTREWF